MKNRIAALFSEHPNEAISVGGAARYIFSCKQIKGGKNVCRLIKVVVNLARAATRLLTHAHFMSILVRLLLLSPPSYISSVPNASA
jgi:hypothetical protein